ncbi:TOMM precursor leader peptide-binding protein [Methylovulum psychrotolerans]|uniref:YcaO domain-containing protein n=1 Tax=Methylovulum psychrotolerans TaxID=1704499 RepID=A0A2S5CJC0_9GAMM|nr:TOMM precursor leader peptide-binding protein [Methylovulum psychrotolerans]POZ50904.1 hypothetical protein AADEFJLK_03376 [Methylovulum psychrotolerans]
MLKRPIFKNHYQVTPIRGEGVLLLSEQDSKALYGSIYEAVAPLLDGRSADAVVAALAGRIDPAKVYYALLRLEQNGYTTELTDIAPEVAAFWHGLGLDPQAMQQHLQQQPINLIALQPAFAEPVRQVFAELDITVAETGQSALDVVLADDYLDLALSAHNRTALATGRPWLLAKLSGNEIWLGPIFVPGQTGCYECLHSRLERHQRARGFVADKLGVGLASLPLVLSPMSLALAARLLALETAKHLAGCTEQPLLGKVLSLNLATLQSQSHTLSRNPCCNGCGEPMPATLPAPIALVKRKVNFLQDGGHRAVSPDQTLRQYQHLVSPITGIVRVLEPVHQADGIAHVYVAGHNYAVPMDTLAFLRRNLRQASSGKGISDTQAKVSALCEAIERDAGLFTGQEHRITASYRELGDAAIHPAACMLYSERQFAGREACNAQGSHFNRIPEPFDDERPLFWSAAWSLTEQRHKYLPSQLLYFQAKAGDNCDTFYCFGCSNGNASGNNLEEAVLQGFCELVERDAVALWWYNRLAKPGVDIASFGEPYLLDLIAYYGSLGRDAWALDLTSDLGLPVFVAISRVRTGKEHILFGFGCHLDARIALQRAFAEMNQMLGLANGCLESQGQLGDADTLAWLQTATVANQPYLLPDPAIAAKRRDDYPCLASGDLLTDILLCQRIVEGKGMEMLVLDQSKPDTGLAVVKVIVPGLRHFWARFAPGRLYDVPVQMGWLAEPLPEEALNPIAMFI